MRTLWLFFALSFAVYGAAPGVTPVGTSEYRARRDAVAKALGPNAMLILQSPAAARRNGDTDWPFKQDDYLFYLTGIAAPDTTLVLVPGEKGRRELLFASEPDSVWTGGITSLEELSRRSGVAEVVSISRFDQFIHAAFVGGGFNDAKVYPYYAPPAVSRFYHAFADGKAEVYALFDRPYGGNDKTSQLVETIRKKYPEVRFRDVTPIITLLREIKSEREIERVQHAVDITIEALKAAMRRAKQVTHEYQLQATVEFTFRDMGADGWGYPSIVGAGMNATTLHYPFANAPVPKDALVLLDVGAEVEGYSADISHTFPANGKFSVEQKAIYEAVYRTSKALMPLYVRKNTLRAINEKANELIAKELLALGLITDASDAEQVRLYFMHGVAHPIGLSVHDSYDRERALEANMISTLEPGIYVNAERVRRSPTWNRLSASERERIEPMLQRYNGIGVRIEDDILVTTSKPRNMSAKVPRGVEEIERFMNQM